MRSDDLGRLRDRAMRLAAAARPGARTMIAITGSPGAGKTTLARELVTSLREADVGAAYLPMDGFHLANATLDRLGRHDRKGAIDTFDGWGFLALLRRVAAERSHTVYAPGFDRTVDEPVAGAIAIEPRDDVVVVEGNYLLVGSEPWSLLRPLFAESWFCATDEATRLARLVDRHTRHGRTPEAATEWATRVDGTNAALIESTAALADVRIADPSQRETS
jgi:pantothenate kinase